MSKSHPRWRLAKKILTWLFFIAVIVLLVVYAKKVDWEEVWKVIRDYNRVALLSAVGLVVVSYLIYGCYDLLARFYCGHKLAKRQVMLVSFYLLRLQPDAQYLGRRHWYALSFVLSSGVAR
ncbi:inner membrane protein [Escherichia coli]|uniref:Inner membrane protein n=1 Tax=Escherichia coli TaxID=562 RepID=A0A377F8H1_ECOLX|nr:inner membrane protein [Escherichia coli]